MDGYPSKKRTRPFKHKKRPVKKARIERRTPNTRVGGFTGIERKFVDYAVNGDAFTTVWAGGEMEDGTALSVSAVAQGDGESQRDGRMYYIESVFIHGHVVRAAVESAVAPLDDVRCRVALVLDTQTNGAQLNAEDVFLTIGAGSDVLSYRNLQYSKRFKILRDIDLVISSTGQTNEGAVNLFAAPQTIVPFKMNYKFKKPIPVHCTGTTAAVSSITDNSIHVIGTAQATSALLTYQSRVRFRG